MCTNEEARWEEMRRDESRCEEMRGDESRCETDERWWEEKGS